MCMISIKSFHFNIIEVIKTEILTIYNKIFMKIHYTYSHVIINFNNLHC